MAIVAEEQSLPQQIGALQEAIRVRYGCASRYSQTRYVRASGATTSGRDALVYVFRLLDRRHAKCCYAWQQSDGARVRVVTVLALPPVDSAESAVRHSTELRSTVESAR